MSKKSVKKDENIEEINLDEIEIPEDEDFAVEVKKNK